MGCDIHTMLEYDGEIWDPAKGEWVPAGWIGSKVKAFPYAYTGIYDQWTNENQPNTDVPLMGRDYELFAMLADVRNDGNITPVYQTLGESELRGIPGDASKRWRKYTDEWGQDLHSCTFYTLAELGTLLKAGAFKQLTWRQGVMSAEQYRRLIEWGQHPSVWSASIGGGGITVGQEHQITEQLTRKTPTPSRIAVPTDIPPMPGEITPSETIEVTDEPKPLSPHEANNWKAQEPLSGFTHIRARWEYVIDREDTIRALLEIARNFARAQGPRPPWGQPDTRPRDLSKVRIMIGFDN